MTNNIFTQKKEVLDLIQNIMENSDTAEILEEKYKLYHKDFSSAMKHAYDTVKKMGYEVDPESINDKVAFGPRKPSSGKTNSYRLDLLKKGIPQKKGVQIQVYNMDNKSYELNMYLEEVELAEATGGLNMLGAAGELEKYAKKYGGMDKKDFLKVAKLMRKGMSDNVVRMTNNLDTEPREKIVDVVANHIGVKSTEKMFGVKFLHRKESVELDENKKAALQKKLAKTAQSSKSGKDKVTLKKAPWDKKEEVLSQIKNLILDEGRKQVLAHGGKGQYKVVSTDGAVDVVFKGKVVGKGDYDRGADSFFISMKGQKGQKSFDDAQDIADYFAKNKIKEEVELQEYSALPTAETLKKMHDEGKTKKQIMAAYSGCDSVKLEKLYAQHCTEELEEKTECPQCEGEGCDHCDGKGYHEELSPKQKKIDKNKNGKIDGSDLANLRKKNEDFDIESLVESSDKKDAKEMADLVKELEPKIKMTELKKQVYDMAMEKYNNKTRAKKIASMIK